MDVKLLIEHMGEGRSPESVPFYILYGVFGSSLPHCMHISKFGALAHVANLYIHTLDEVKSSRMIYGVLQPQPYNMNDSLA